MSFCLVDNYRVKDAYGATYTDCGRERQGLTPGWVDDYHWNIPDQWIVLGSDPLPDGDYALRSIADPLDLLSEGGGEQETNNERTTYFGADEVNDCVGPRSYFNLP